MCTHLSCLNFLLAGKEDKDVSWGLREVDLKDSNNRGIHIISLMGSISENVRGEGEREEEEGAQGLRVCDICNNNIK